VSAATATVETAATATPVEATAAAAE